MSFNHENLLNYKELDYNSLYSKNKDSLDFKIRELELKKLKLSTYAPNRGLNKWKKYKIYSANVSYLQDNDIKLNKTKRENEWLYNNKEDYFFKSICVEQHNNKDQC